MTTERSQKRPFRTILRRVPISKKLQFMVFVFVCIFFAVLALVFLCSGFTSAARAYVQGEGSWSKAQKQATIRLLTYAASRNEKDYQAFLDSLSVPLGDRVAREQLESQSRITQQFTPDSSEGKSPMRTFPEWLRSFEDSEKRKRSMRRGNMGEGG